ncbi:MAG: deoxyribonuclease IV [Candidatus Dadabacteria bacterium]|nr:MAG: deoxyribonuclease IV [Candidatus Dadabacteria bacterium]
MDRYFGCHVSSAGGLHKALENADILKVNAIQIHPSPPQIWTKPFKEDHEKEYLQRIKDSGVKKVFFHAIYLINLATPDKRKFHLSKMSLVYYLDLLARIKGDGVVVHVGSNRDQKTEEEGFERAAYGINWVLENSNPNSKLLLEVAAGSGAIIGDRMEELRTIYDMVEDKKRVGFALDTQHMWASGYDIKRDLEGVVKEIRKNFGLRKIGLVHLNDSKTEFNSKRDRHENLGQGTIGSAALKAFINHPALAKIPVVLETPGLKTIDGAKSEVSKLKRMISGK